MTKTEEKLIRFGLSRNEIQVYLAVLQVSECSVGTIEKTTKLHRQIIYNAANSLAEKNLLSITRQGGRRRFIAADPDNFEQLAQQRLDEAKALSRELRLLKSQIGFLGESRLYKGSREIQRYYLDATSYQPIKSCVDIIGVNSKRFFEIFPQDSMGYKLLEQRRIERKIRWRLLLSGASKEEQELNQGREFLECRLINQKGIVPIDLMIWRDHVGILIYGEEPCVLDIPGNKPAQGFKKYFALLWEQGQKELQ